MTGQMYNIYHRKFKFLISLVDKKKRWQYNSVYMYFTSLQLNISSILINSWFDVTGQVW